MLTFASVVVVLGVLIIFHELGHFIMAKLTGIGVEKFSIGFGPKVWGKLVGGTEYKVSAFPLGGFVKMVGENPDEAETVRPFQPPKPIDPARSFLLKPVWVRLVVVTAGPAFNFLLAVFLFALILSVGVTVYTSRVGQVQESTPAMAAGLKAGDLITAIDGRKITDWDEITDLIHGSPGKSLAVTIRRGQEDLALMVTPESRTVKNLFGEDTTVGLVGIVRSEEKVTRRVNPLTASGMALNQTWQTIKLTFIVIAKIFQRVVPADTIGGPIMMAQMAGEQARLGIINFLSLLAFLSIQLGVFNLLPIPILDGGHVLFFLIEAVRGKPLSLKKREIAQQIGLVIIVSLFLFAIYNDVSRVVPGLVEQFAR